VAIICDRYKMTPDQVRMLPAADADLLAGYIVAEDKWRKKKQG